MAFEPVSPWSRSIESHSIVPGRTRFTPFLHGRRPLWRPEKLHVQNDLTQRDVHEASKQNPSFLRMRGKLNFSFVSGYYSSRTRIAITTAMTTLAIVSVAQNRSAAGSILCPFQ